jgi:hypothetical protein
LIQAIDDDNPIYQNIESARALGYEDIIAPPTFTTIPILWSRTLFWAFEDLKIELTNIIHAEQGYAYSHEILPGDNLRGIIEVKKITKKEGKSGNLQLSNLKPFSQIRMMREYPKKIGVC